MPIGLVAAGIGAAGGIASAVIGSNAAKAAANTQAQSAQNALDFQRQVYQQNQKTLQPFITAGTGATNRLSAAANGDFSQFYTSPDYQFRQQQGELGITRGANARGLNLSGGTLKDLAQFNSGLASTEYGNYYNRLMDLAKMGSGAASSLAGNNNTSATTIGNTTQALGQAQASGVIGTANAYMGGINGIGQNALLGAYLGRNQSAYGSNNLGNMFFGGGSPSGYGTGS